MRGTSRPLSDKMPQHRASITQCREALKHRADGKPHGVIWILHHGTIRTTTIANRQSNSQLAALGLSRQRSMHAGLQDMQLRREQGALHAKQ